MSKAVAYIRVSTKKQGEVEGKRIIRGNGLEDQQATIREFCEREGLELTEQFVEVQSGKGADALDRRPQLAAALRQAKRQGAYLVVAKLDRLSRNVHFITGLMEKGCKLVVVPFGLHVDPFTMHIHASVAEQERKLIAERTKAGLARVKANGKRLGNPQIDQIRRASAETIKASADEEAARMVPMIRAIQTETPGISLRGIAEKLSERRVSTARGGEWTAMQVSRLLKRVDNRA